MMTRISSPRVRRIGRAARKKLIRELFRRDAGSCRMCGRPLSLASSGDDMATIGHIWPHALGGASTLENTRLECAACNQAHGMLPCL